MGGIVVCCVGLGASRLLRFETSQIDGRFEIESVLAEHQFYSRYVAFDRVAEVRRLVELQRIQPHNLMSWRARAGIATRLRHPALLRCVEARTLSDTVGLLVLEPPPREAGPVLLGPEVVARVGVSILSLLALLHRMGLGLHVPLTHRTYWGSARPGPDVRVEVVSRGVGGFHHEPFCARCLPDVPPEIIQGGTSTRSSDLYLVGSFLYRLLTGNPLPSGSIEGGERMNNWLGPEIRRLLDTDAESRPTAGRSCRALTDLLKRHGTERTPPALFGSIDPESEQVNPRMLSRLYVAPGLSSSFIERIAREEGGAAHLESGLVRAIWEDGAGRGKNGGCWESVKRLEREGEVAKALGMLKRIDSQEAERARSRLAWRNGDWSEIERLRGGGHGDLEVLLLRQQGRLDEAEKVLTSLNKEEGYWLECGWLYMTSGHAEKALHALQIAVSEARLPQDEARARAYLGLQFTRMGRAREGGAEIERANELLKDEGNKLIIREVRLCEAEVDLWTGRWSRAKRSLSTLVSESRSSGDSWILQNGLLKLAELDLLTGAKGEALARIEEARRVAGQRRDLEGRLSAQLLEVEALAFKREWGAVRKKAKSLERHFASAPFARIRARWLLWFGRSILECGEPSIAAIYLREARDLNRMLSEPDLEARLDAAEAAQLLKEKQRQDAVLTFNKAIEMLEEASLPYFLAEMYADFISLCSEFAPPSLVQLRQRSTARMAAELGAQHLLNTIGIASTEKTARIASPGFVATSSSMLGVLEQVERAAAFDVTVLLQGESGTGKELVARALHRQSPRVHAPFVPLNCAAIPDSLFETEIFGHVQGAFTGADRPRAGLVEEANGGTLFLDEVADLSPRGQTSLLRVLQDNEYRRLGESKVRQSDFRLIAATHKRLAEEVEAGRFREDLYFRLKVFEVHVPALRERRDDILPLAKHFLSEKATQLGLPKPSLEEGASEALLAYSWPGNVRELENEILQALLRLEKGTELRREHLSSTLRGKRGRPLRFASQDFERRYLREVLDRHGGNRTRAARALGLTRQALYKKLRKHGMELTVPQAI